MRVGPAMVGTEVGWGAIVATRAGAVGWWRITWLGGCNFAGASAIVGEGGSAA